MGIIGKLKAFAALIPIFGLHGSGARSLPARPCPARRGQDKAEHGMTGQQALGGVDDAMADTSKMTDGSMSDTALGIAAVEFRGAPR